MKHIRPTCKPHIKQKVTTINWWSRWVVGLVLNKPISLRKGIETVFTKRIDVFIWVQICQIIEEVPVFPRQYSARLLLQQLLLMNAVLLFGDPSASRENASSTNQIRTLNHPACFAVWIVKSHLSCSCNSGLKIRIVVCTDMRCCQYLKNMVSEWRIC